MKKSKSSPKVASEVSADRVVPSSFGPGTLSRDALVSLLYGVAVRLGTLGLSIAAARQLGSAGAGELGVALQVVALASLLATCNLPQGLTQHLSRTPNAAARDRLLRISGWLIAIPALVTAGVLMVSAPTLARDVYADSSLTPVLFACGPLTLAAAAYLWAEGALQGLRRFDLLARWGVVTAGFDVLLGVIASTWSVLAMLVIRTVLRLAAATVAASRFLRPDRESVRRTDLGDGEPQVPLGVVAASMFAFAGPTLVAGALMLLGNTLLRVLLVRSNTLAAAGQYQAADSLAQGVTLVPIAAAAAFMPAVAALSGRAESEVSLPFRRAIEKVAGYNVPVCLGTIGLAPWIMVNVFGRDFGAARPVLVVLVCAYASVGPCAVFGAWLMGRNRPWTILVINALWAACILLFFSLGLSHWGALGAALASAAAYWVALACYVLFVAPSHSLPWSSHLPAVLVTLVALGIGAALQLLPGVPVALAVGGNLTLAGIVFARWGAPSMAASGLMRWRS